MAVKEDTDLLERLAYLEHAQWVEWMEYFISKTFDREIHPTTKEVRLSLPLKDWNRWLSQIKRNYHALTEQEKDSDRKFARKVMEILDSGNEPKTTTTKVEEVILPRLLERRGIWDIQKWILEMQIQNQHLLYHQDRDCTTKDSLCYSDFTQFVCPRCWNGPRIFEGWNQTDEHDTYLGFKCRSCNYSYCISH